MSSPNGHSSELNGDAQEDRILPTGKCELFSDAEQTYYRSLVPTAGKEGVTYLDAAGRPPMNNKIRGAIDAFLDQAVNVPQPKPFWRQMATEAKTKLARFVNVPSDSLAFTADTTEAMNLFQRSIRFREGDNVVVLEVEHPHQVYGWLALRDDGLEVRRVVLQSRVAANADTFAPHVDERTVAIGLSSIMFESGLVNDVQGVCDRYRSRGIHVLADVAQHVGFAPLDLSAWNVSAAAFTCHKGLGCPTGVGVLYINPQTISQLRAHPPIVGSDAVSNHPVSQIANPDAQYLTSALRFQHQNLSSIAIAGLLASLDLLMDVIGIDRLESHTRALGQVLADRCKSLGLELHQSQYLDQRAPNIYVLPLLHPEWRRHFREEGVCVSHYRLGIRVSLGFYNIVPDVDGLVQVIERGLKSGIPLA